MRKIIYLTKYSSLGASSRLRSFQFFPFLELEGFSVSNSALLGDRYLKALYNHKRIKVFYLVVGYLKRFFVLFGLKRFDIVVIEKELFPYSPAWFELLLKKLGIEFFTDYDDAIFHNYDLSTNKYIKKILSNKIDFVMRSSVCVFAGNSYLAERAKHAGAPKIVILPTVIDSNKYFKIEKTENAYFTLGWIGSPSTLKYVEELIPVFYRLHKKFTNFRVNIIGGKVNEEVIDFIHFIPWQEKSEVEEINKFDLGIMPLHQTPWELGKCSYKLIQYMGCGVAALASPVGMNNDVVIAGYNGELVENNEWYSYVSAYIENKRLAKIQGEHGRILVDSTYNIKQNLTKILAAFEN